MGSDRKEIKVCCKGSCTKNGAELIWKAIKKYVTKYELEDKYTLERSKCLGLCRHGPIVRVEDDKCSYGVRDKKDCKDIVKRHAKKKKPLKKLVISYKK